MTKTALSPAASGHVGQMAENYPKLEKMYPDSRSLQESFSFAKSITAFRMDIAPEKFQAARRVRQGLTKEIETK